MARDVSMCHAQQSCGWDIVYMRLQPPGTTHVVGYLQEPRHQRIAYSPQTHLRSVEIIHRNGCEKTGCHHARISTHIICNHLKRITRHAGRPNRGPILNRQWRAARLHWVRLQCLFFLNLPHTGLPWIKCNPYTALASVLTVLYHVEHRRGTCTDCQIRPRDPPPDPMVQLCPVIQEVWDAIPQARITHLGAVSIRKTVLPGMAIPMLKIRRPNGRLIFNMEIAIRR